MCSSEDGLHVRMEQYNEISLTMGISLTKVEKKYPKEHSKDG